ncbi:hypothetical protein ACFQX4_22695 [Roseomonas sp. GCM10028921]
MSKQLPDARSFVADLIEGRTLHLANQNPELAHLLGAGDLVRQALPMHPAPVRPQRWLERQLGRSAPMLTRKVPSGAGD